MRDTIVVKFIPADRWYRRAKWELQEEYTSITGNVEVPIGFITDGASIPLYAQIIFSPTGRYFGAAIIHDYILSTTQDWDTANDEIEIELIASNIARWRRVLIVGGVRFWARMLKLLGKKSWND